jgi:hypothetical protein
MTNGRRFFRERYRLYAPLSAHVEALGKDDVRDLPSTRNSGVAGKGRDGVWGETTKLPPKLLTGFGKRRKTKSGTEFETKFRVRR